MLLASLVLLFLCLVPAYPGLQTRVGGTLRFWDQLFHCRSPAEILAVRVASLGHALRTVVDAPLPIRLAIV